jgi:formylglycine-generating enzyme required for sulfatase activity
MTTHTSSIRALALGALVLAACAPSVVTTPAAATLARPSSSPTPTPFVLATHPIRLLTQVAIPSQTPRPTATIVDSGPLPMLQAESLTWVSPTDGMKLIGIPAGGFWMGSDKDDVFAEPDEWPQRRVQLAGYWMDETEVTNAEYARCVSAGACTPPPTVFGAFSPHAYYGEAAYDDYPVVNVTWEQASQYCTWAGRRLPTEAEWEKAARGVSGRRFPWEWIGVADPEKLNFCDQRCDFVWHVADVDDGYAETAPVGSYPKGASPYKVLDMAGNVWEWTADWYGAGYYKEGPARDPLGPDTGIWRVVRGGSWLDGVRGRTLVYARSANRYYQFPDTARSDIGFRCVLSAEP